MNRLMLRSFIFLGLAWYLNPVFAQLHEPRFRHFDAKDGLSSTAVTGICQDKEGKIWVGTHDGLNCHYGTYFKSFFQDRKNENGLSQSAVSDLVCGPDGLLWISLYGGGLNLLDPLKMTFLPLPKALKKIGWRQANCLEIDADGKIWAGFYEGLLVYDPKTNKLDTLCQIGSTKEKLSVTRIGFDAHNQAFVATPFSGMLVFTSKNRLIIEQHFPFSGFDSTPKGIGFFNQLWEENDTMHAASQTGIFQLYKKNENWTMRRKQAFLGKEVLTFLKDAFGRKWFSVPEGISLEMDGKASEKRKTKLLKSLKNNRIEHIFRDRWGGIWLGGASGLDYTHPQLAKFQSYSSSHFESKKALNIVWHLFTEDDQKFLLASESGLFGFDSQNPKSGFFLLDNKTEERMGFQFFKTRNKKLLLGTIQGIFELKGSFPKYQFEKFAPEIGAFISSFSEMKNGNLLVGAYDENGLYEIGQDGKVKNQFLRKEGELNSLCNNSINVIRQAREGKLWIGTDQGFCLFDPAKGIFDSHIWENLPQREQYSPLIYDLVETETHLWIATFGSGIIYFDKQTRKYEFINKTKGLPNESVYRLEKSGPHLWASTNKGLCKIDLKRLKIQVFTEGDGLQSDEFNHFSSFQNPATGFTYFGGLNGFDEVSRGLPSFNTQTPKIVLSSAKVFMDDSSRTLPLDGTQWDLAFHQQSIEIEFAALNYLMPEKNQYAYWLEGSGETRKIELGNKNKITLVGLQPGDYVLKLTGTNNEGLWSARAFEIPICIHPPFWKTWWFILLLVLAFALVLFFAFRWYLGFRLRLQILAFEKQQAIKSERNRISADMHDDLGTGLTSIKMLSELIKLKWGQSPMAELDKIGEWAGELVDNLNTIVWALNDRNDKLEAAVAYLRSFCSKQFEDRPIDLKISTQVDGSVAHLEISGETRRNLFLILKEALHNIEKHAQATEVKIEMKASREIFVLSIVDNGKSEPKSAHSLGGNGLKNMKERATSLGARIWFERKDGFQIFLEMPLQP
jgi:ligand-binding sensor domain-containing protein